MASGQFLFVKSLHPTPHPQALDTKCERVKKLTDFYISKVSHGCSSSSSGVAHLLNLGFKSLHIIAFSCKENTLFVQNKIRVSVLSSSEDIFFFSILYHLFKSEASLSAKLLHYKNIKIISFFSLKVSVN